MKKLSFVAVLLLVGTACFAQTKNLPKPNMQRKTLTVMEAYQQRKSVREYSTKQLSDQDLSDLLWAAQGKNRPDGHITAPTAMNKQEIRLYVFDGKGVSLYDPQNHLLTQPLLLCRWTLYGSPWYDGSESHPKSLKAQRKPDSCY